MYLTENVKVMCKKKGNTRTILKQKIIKLENSQITRNKEKFTHCILI